MHPGKAVKMCSRMHAERDSPEGQIVGKPDVEVGRAIRMRDFLASPAAFKVYLSEHCNTTVVSLTAPSVEPLASGLSVRGSDMFCYSHCCMFAAVESKLCCLMGHMPASRVALQVSRMCRTANPPPLCTASCMPAGHCAGDVQSQCARVG